MFDNLDLTWAPPVLAMFTIVGVIAGMIRWLVKHYFDAIKAEFQPNGGGSLKDQMNRLENEHRGLSDKLDKIEKQNKDSVVELSKKIDNVYTTIIDILGKK